MARVLLLEPNQVLSEQYKVVLTKKGYEVAVRAGAQAAILAADAKAPDIIVMELMLAGHSGIEFLYELRSYAEWQRIPVIILSRIAQDDSGLDSKALKGLGIEAVLYKPDTSLEKLAATIDRLVK